MTARVLVALGVVLGAYFAPSFVDSTYTTEAVLRENAYYHAAAVVLFVAFVRGWVCTAVCAIEIGLLAAGYYLAVNWDLRDIIFVGLHYPAIQQAGFILELAIITGTALTRLGEIGADANRLHTRLSALLNHRSGGKWRA